jgi:5'-nucleotidase
VAAAIEGAILGIPAIAVSVASFRDQVWEGAVHYIRDLVINHSRDLMKKGTLLNINVPNLPWEEIKGVAVTALGSRFYGDVIIRKEDPRGREYFWIGGEEPTWLEDKTTDFHAVHTEKKISITPLKLDLTNKEKMAELTAWAAK